MDNFVRERQRGLGRRGLPRKGAVVLLVVSLLMPGPAARAAEFEITADSFTVVNQVNISSTTYFQARAIAPPDPALATQLLTPGGLYFDATYYNVWDRTSLAWVKLATGTAEAGRVAKAGDFMSGQLTTASTITVQGSAFSVGASTFVVIGGKVGVGTTNPIAMLHAVQGYADATPTAYFRKSAGTSAGKVLELKTDYNSGDGSILEASNADATAVVIKNSGDVGIGTASPESRLHIKGTGSILAEMRLTELTATGGGSISGQLVGANGGVLRVFTHNDSGSLIERMRINESGSVGIGTTAPAEGFRLDVSSPSGTGIRLTDSANLSSLRIESGNDISTITAAKNGAVPTTINMRTQSASGSLTDTLTLSGGAVGIGTTVPSARLHVSKADAVASDNLILVSSGASAGQELWVVKGDGKVGIGTASPAARLDVNGGGIFRSTSGIGNVWFGYNDGTRDYGVYQWQAAGAAPANYFQNNIGIGTTGPGAKLDIKSSGVSTYPLRVLASDGGNMGYFFEDAGQHAIFDLFDGGGNNDIRLNTNGDSWLAGGNVGIGTASPAQKLDVSGGNIQATGASGAQASVYVNKPAATDAQALTFRTGGVDKWNLGVRANNSYLEFWDSPAGTSMFTILAGGNVGVGVAAPTAKLHVGGTPGVDGIRFPDGTLMTTAAGTSTGQSSATDLNLAADSDANGSGVMTLATAAQERVRVANNGNVGIRTNDPISLLTVKSTAPTGGPQLFLEQDNASDGWLIQAERNYGDITFSRRGDGGAGNVTERLRIKAAGNVGIGTTSPSDALHVYRDYDSAGSRTSNAATLLVDGAPGKDAWLGWGVGGVTSFVAGFDNGEKQLDFWGHNDTSWNHTLAMTTTGQVGIGTRFPYNGVSSAKLDVRGRLFVTDPGDLPTGMYISRSGGPTADWNSPGGTWGVYRYGSAQSDRFCIGVVGVNEPFCVLTGGNVGVGTTNPGYKLDVNGDLNLAAGGVYRIGGVAQSGSSKWTAGTGDNIYRTFGKVGVGTGDPTLGKLHAILGSVNGPLALQAEAAGVGTDLQWFDNDDVSYKWDLSYRGSLAGDNLHLYRNPGSPDLATTWTIGGRVGVGAGENPAARLHVSSANAVAADTILQVSSGTSAGQELLVVKGDGKVGIGTTGPDHALDVRGNIFMGAPEFGSFAAIADAIYLGHTRKILSNATGVAVDGSTDWMNLLAHSGSKGIILGTSGSADATPHDAINPRMVIQAGGNVGVGAAAPGTGFGSASWGTLGSGSGNYFSTHLYGNKDGGALLLEGNDSVHLMFADRNSAANQKISRILSQGGKLAFQGLNDALDVNGQPAVANDNVLVVDYAAGNVGVGTASTGAKLDVDGDIAVGAPSATAVVSANGGPIQMRGTTDVVLHSDSDNDTSGEIVFQKGAPGSPTNLARITNGGNFRIGNHTNDAYPLTVDGDVAIGQGTVGCVVDRDGTVIAGTCISDERLKKDVRPLDPLLDRLTALRPVTYSWRSEEFPEFNFSDSVQTGLVAQEVEKGFPDLVETDPKGFKRVNYSQLPLYLLQAIKDQQAEISALRKEVAELKAK